MIFFITSDESFLDKQPYYKYENLKKYVHG